jgi:ligand-binding sensor domain-containing protein
MNNGLTNPSVQRLATNGTVVFAGTYLGAFASSDNGASWSSISSGLPSGVKATSLLSVSNGNKLFLGTENNGVHLSSDNGASWTNVTNNMAITPVKALAAGSNVVYAGVNGNGVYWSSDNGSNWVQSFNGLSSVMGSSGWIYCLTMSNGELYAGTSNGVFKTSAP